MPFSDNEKDLAIKLAIAGGLGYAAKKAIERKDPTAKYDKHGRYVGQDVATDVGEQLDAYGLRRKSLRESTNPIGKRLKANISKNSLASINKKKTLNIPDKDSYRTETEKKKPKMYNVSSKSFEKKTLGYKPSYPKTN